jgi:Helix-turn-helix domain
MERTEVDLNRFTPYDSLPERLTVEEFASAAGLSRAAAYDYARRDLIPTLRLGRRIFVMKTALSAREDRLIAGATVAVGDHS